MYDRPAGHSGQALTCSLLTCSSGLCAPGVWEPAEPHTQPLPSLTPCHNCGCCGRALCPQADFPSVLMTEMASAPFLASVKRSGR